MSDQWFVHSDDQQMGPYSGEQLVQYAQEGNIAPETLIWAEGMAEWSPASQIPGLFPEVAAAQPVEVAKAPAWAPPGARGAMKTATGAAPLAQASAAGGDYPYAPIKPASFGLWLWTLLGGFILMILATVVFSLAAKSSMDSSAAGMDQEAVTAAAAGKAGFGLLLLGLGGLSLMLSMIFSLINIHRAWGCLAWGAPATTPGKAVGMLFIPFFNIYWMFVAIAGLPKDWNRIVAAHGNLNAAPRLSEGMFLMYCIGSLVFPPLALVVMFPMMSQVCKGVNFFAFRRDPNAASAYGGLRLR
jgi:GYF domain 2